jgi:hypothetical protein
MFSENLRWKTELKVAKIRKREEKRQYLTAKRGFDGWSRRFSEAYDQHTRLEDLSDSTLAQLIQPGEESSMAINEFIMGVQGLGPGLRFHFLENLDKMALMDITLFLLDQLRFEAMRRLGWVVESPISKIRLVDLVAEFPTRFSRDKHLTPPLAPDHPQYQNYQNTFEGDRAAFIRRLIPEALEAFRKRIEG